jgi:hypothetical protein
MKGITVSERVFEEYLRSRGIKDYRYEEPVKGIAKPVDYSFNVDGVTLRCDVKEWKPTKGINGVSTIDPYGPIRTRIDKGKAKFKEYKGRGEPCCLVLHHHGPQPIILDIITIYGAMLGDVGFEFPISLKGTAAFEDEGHMTFVGGGRMVEMGRRPDRGVPTNKTISTILVPGYFSVRDFQVGIAVQKRDLADKAANRKLSITERFEMVYEIYEKIPDSETVPCVMMYDNPFATVRVPTGFPAGPDDERYGMRDGRLVRLYVGDRLRECERTQKELGMEVKDPFHLKG